MKQQLNPADYIYMQSIYTIYIKAIKSGIKPKVSSFKDGTSKIEFPGDFPIPFIIVNSRLWNIIKQRSLIGLS